MVSELGHEREKNAGDGDDSPAFGDWGDTPRIPSTGTSNAGQLSREGGEGAVEQEGGRCV